MINGWWGQSPLLCTAETSWKYQQSCFTIYLSADSKHSYIWTDWKPQTTIWSGQLIRRHKIKTIINHQNKLSHWKTSMDQCMWMDGKRYSVLTKTTECLKCLFHPVYLSDNPSHPFYVVPPKVSGAKNVAGPVYLTKNARHKYAEFI